MGGGGGGKEGDGDGKSKCNRIELNLGPEQTAKMSFFILALFFFMFSTRREFALAGHRKKLQK